MPLSVVSVPHFLRDPFPTWTEIPPFHPPMVAVQALPIWHSVPCAEGCEMIEEYPLNYDSEVSKLIPVCNTKVTKLLSHPNDNIAF